MPLEAGRSRLVGTNLMALAFAIGGAPRDSGPPPTANRDDSVRCALSQEEVSARGQTRTESLRDEGRPAT